MEQPETDDVLRSVPSPPRRHTPSLSTLQSTPRLAQSQPNPEPPHTELLADSVLSLRFPRPVGNRQLTNWISSSSPDIMQPANTPDDGPSLTDLGYDIIGTDGESQAESIASSFDYQRSDDIQSLTGTDVDTDSSDDEETTINETILSDATLIDEPRHDDNARAESLSMMDESLESPTSLSLSTFSPFTSFTYLDHLRASESELAIRGPSSPMESLAFVEQKITTGSLVIEGPGHSEPDLHLPKACQGHGALRIAFAHVYKQRRALTLISAFVLFYGLTLYIRLLLFGLPLPRELSTVPVASVPFVVPQPSAKTVSPVLSPTSMVSQAPTAVQTSSSPNGLTFIPFGKDVTQAAIVTVPESEAICSAELASRDEILIRIPQTIKSSWLARDAILIAVSRGPQDIPTKVSCVDDGFLIQVPLKEAHGVLAVTIATTRKPRINEAFRVNFGMYRFTEALDAGKQLVRGFAQRVVDTMNETTSWVEETYIPALDVVSKQVRDQTASASDSMLHGLQEASGAILAIPSHIIAQIRHSLRLKSLLRRAGQLRLELAQETRNLGDELRMAMLMSRVNSKLVWLKMQGKTEEHGQYLSKAEIHMKEERARVESARAERAETTKKQIRAWHERDHPVEPKGSFWSIMGAWAGHEE